MVFICLEMYQNISECNTINYPKNKMKYFIVVVGTIFLLNVSICDIISISVTLHERYVVSNYRQFDCSVNRFMLTTNKTSAIPMTGEGNPPGIG